jgi:lipoprotein-releasing system permease protein
MIRSDRTAEGIVIKGVDPERDISAAKTRLVSGVYDIAERDSGLQSVIIGRRLAERLGVGIGDRVLLFGLGGTTVSLSQTRILQVIVRGIYGMAEYDGSYVYLHLRNAQRLLQVGRTVSGYDLLVHDVATVDRLAREIPEDLGYPYYARTMFQQYRNLFTWIELQKKPIPIILGLIIIVATVNIVGTLLMMVLEKAKEVGTLRTLGMSRRTIVKIFQWKGMLIGLAGTAAGNIVAYVLCWIELKYRFFPLPSGVYFMTHVPIEMSVWDFLLVSGSALVMCYLASMFPARVAASLDPIKTLRFS